MGIEKAVAASDCATALELADTEAHGEAYVPLKIASTNCRLFAELAFDKRLQWFLRHLG